MICLKRAQYEACFPTGHAGPGIIKFRESTEPAVEWGEVWLGDGMHRGVWSPQSMWNLIKLWKQQTLLITSLQITMTT